MTAPPRDPVCRSASDGRRPAHLPVLLDEAMAWLDPTPGRPVLRRHARRRRARRGDARTVGAGRSADRAGPGSGGARGGGRAPGTVRRPRDAGPRALLGGARGARTPRDDSGRRLPGRSRRVVAAARPPGARVLVPERTVRSTCAWTRRPARPRPSCCAGWTKTELTQHHPRPRRGAARGARRARHHRSAARRAGRDHGQAGGASSRARCRATSTARTRRRGPSRRCASPSTTSWASWSASSTSPPTACARADGWCVIAFHSLEDRIVKRRLRELAGRGGARRADPAVLRLLTKHVVVAGDEERAPQPARAFGAPARGGAAVKTATLNAIVKPDLRQPARRRRVGVPAGAVHGGRAGARRGAHARHPDRVRARARAAHQHGADEQRRRLNIEIGMLKDPDRVIGIAREKLGMGPPAPENVVRWTAADWRGRSRRPWRRRAARRAWQGAQMKGGRPC